MGFNVSITLSQSLDAPGENLVVNPSFEQLTPEQFEELTLDIDACEGWNSPNKGFPRVYGTSSYGNIFDAFGSSWNFQARTGSKVAALQVYESKRDYIQGRLSEPLEIGKKYHFSFWVHYHCEGANNIGIAFLPGEMQLDSSGVIPLVPAAYQQEVTNYDTSHTWTMVVDSFVAQKAYKNFIIGNFFTDEQTRLQSNRYRHHLAYVDDIQVFEGDSLVERGVDSSKQILLTASWDKNDRIYRGESSQPPTEQPEKPKPEVRNPIEVAPILFPFDSYQLSQEQEKQLDSLAQSLLQEEYDTLELVGYTCDTGTETYNMNLSKNRVEAVCNFFYRKRTGKRKDSDVFCRRDSAHLSQR